jgi:hypothetical protein
MGTLGPNCHSVRVGPLVLGFSYETVVTFFHPDTGWVVSQNVWSSATGRHINLLTGDVVPVGDRLPHEEFWTQLAYILDRIRVTEETSA